VGGRTTYGGTDDVALTSATPDEWQAFIDRDAAYVNPRNLWFALAYAGLLLRDALRVRVS
jgi:hypothetical protein